MRTPVLLPVLCLLLGTACKNDPPAADKPAAPKAAPTANASAAGGGDKSGSSVPNARPLSKDAPTSFTVPCSGSFFVGPFSLKKDPEQLVVQAKVKSVKGTQVCPGGKWVDASGKFVAVAGLGCVENANVVDVKISYEYSPGNGGSSASTVYLSLEYPEPKPASCDSAQVTLSL